MDPVLYVGFDETNHGKIPEIATICFSMYGKYVQKENKIKRLKSSKKIEQLMKEFRHLNINYRFSVLTEKIKEHFKGNYIDILPTTMFSLLKGEDVLEKGLCKFVKPFIDGVVGENQKELIIKTCNPLGIDIMKIYSGEDYDIKIPLVNYSDAISRYLRKMYEKNNNLEVLLTHPNYKPIIFPPN